MGEREGEDMEGAKSERDRERWGAEGGVCRQWAEKRGDRETVVGERESGLVKR